MREITDKELANEVVEVLSGNYTKYFFNYKSVWAMESIDIEFVVGGDDDFYENERAVKKQAKKLLKKECIKRGISEEKFRKQNWMSKKIYASLNGAPKEDITLNYSKGRFLQYLRKLDESNMLNRKNLIEGKI